MKISHFFIERPIFAGAVSIVITLLGLIAYFGLAVDQYPAIAPPTITISASYPGATAEELANNVAAPLEQQINGINGMLYVSSQSSSDGRVAVTVTFKVGTNVDQAQVEVQNRIQSALPQLPQEVRDLGLVVRRAQSDTLLAVHMYASDDTIDRKYIANYATLQVRERLLRVPGVGEVGMRAARDYAMRIWIDPDRAAARDLTVQEIVAALRNSNLQVAGGNVGAPPFDDEPSAHQLSVRARGRLTTPEEFLQVIIKRDGQGRTTRISDVARVEFGAQSYEINAYKSGKPAVTLVIQQAPGSNALDVADEVEDTMRQLAAEFPAGVAYDIIYTPVSYTRAAVREVQRTLVDATILVVLVVMLFLQRWRTAIIPLLAIPVSLIGTLAVMAVFGFSLNNLSMFGLILSIGIVVDDAIVVVENVERHLRGGMTPRQAAHVTMDEVGGALIAIALVLVAVFIPTAFMGGIAGRFYQQFALTVATATIISLIVSLTLSPAMAALLLEPHDTEPSGGRWLRRLSDIGKRATLALDGFGETYGRWTARAIRMASIMLVVYAGLLAITAWRVVDTPRGFIPTQDQSMVSILIMMPPGTSLARTDAIVQQLIPLVHATPGVAESSSYSGAEANSTSASTGQIFAIFDSFEKRLPRGQTAASIVADLRKRLSHVTAADIRITMPAPVRGLGSASGFRLMIEDRHGMGSAALEEVTRELIEAAVADPAIQSAFTNLKGSDPALDADVHREKAELLGVPVRNVFATLQTYLAGTYVNNVSLLGHTFQVIAQGDTAFRNDEAWIGKLKTRSAAGTMVPIDSVATVKPVTAPSRVTRYNLYPAADIQADSAPGFSTGEAMAAMERIVRERLPAGFAFEWTDIAYQQQLEAGSSSLAFLLGVVFVFVFLAALYESVTLPLAVILIVPMCLLAAILGVNLLGLDNNILTQISMVVLIGLAAKNAILIVEFARQGQVERGLSAAAAAVEAARTRLRPILMTSIAFIFGVAPLAFGSGAGAELRHALGVPVFFGMIGVTLFGLIFTPVFYVVTRRT